MLIGDLVMRVLINDKAFDADLQKTAAKSGDKAGKTLGSKMSGGLKGAFKGGKGELLGMLGLGAGIGIATVAVAKLGEVIGDSIQDASNLNEAVSKSQAVFKDGSAAIEAWAETASEGFGQSKRQALEAAGTFGNLIQAFGLGEEEASKMSMTLVELASDLASFNNTSVDEAIIALRSGLSGETEPLKRYGIAISDARMRTELMAMGVKKLGATLTPLQKTQAAYALILKDSTLAQGDFARTADGLANTQKSLSAQMEDLSAELGAELLPIMLEFATALKDDIIPNAKTLLDIFRDMAGTGQGLGDVFSELVDAMNPVAGSFLDVRDKVKELEAAAERSTRQLASTMDHRSTEIRGDLATVGEAFDGVGTRSTVAAETARVSMKAMRDGSRALRDAFVADALAILADYYDPIEQRQELITLQREATEQRQIIASKNSTKAQIADAKTRLTQIERRTNELLFELGITGKATQKEISAAITVWQKKARTAKGQALADIRAIIRQLFLLRLAALSASGALKLGGGIGMGGGGRASGGPVQAGVPYVVGERRAELFVPKVDGTILPSVPKDWGSMGGSVTNNYPTLNVQGALPVRTIRDISIEMQRISSDGVTPSRTLSPQYDRREAD